MAAYKDELRGTWYVSFHYYDWTGKNCRKVKRGFKTKREATEWERHVRMKEAAELDMTFEDFVKAYTRDMKPKLKHNTWLTKDIFCGQSCFPILKTRKCVIFVRKTLSSGKMSRFLIVMKRESPMLRLI